MSGNSKMRAPATHQQDQLRGSIGTFELMFTVLAYNAPLSVFIGGIPVVMLVGNRLGAPVALLAGGAVVAMIAFGLTCMSSRLKRSGGFYSFISAGLGKVPGLAAGFAATICYFVAILVAAAFAGIAARTLIEGVFGGPAIPWWITSVLLLAVTSYLGYLNINLSAAVLSFFLVLELLIMGAYVIAVIAHGGGPQGFGLESFTPEQIFAGSVPLAFMLGIGMFGGFEATVIFRDEVRNPDRTIPRATFGVVGLMAGMYALLGWIFINSYGPGTVMAIVTDDPAGSATESIRQFTGEWAYYATAILMFTSAFALLLAAHNITSRYIFNLSSDGILPRVWSTVHPRHKSPAAASVAVTGASFVALAFFIVFQVNEQTMYARVVGVYSYLLLVILSMVALAIAWFLLREPEGGKVRAAGISTGIGFAIVASVLVLATKNFSLLSGATGALAVFLIVLIWGLVVAGGALALRLRTTRPDVYRRIGRDPS
jgi:amino acid transporter